MYDVLVIGSGPAGVSAALTARSRGRSVLVVGNDYHENPLAKAPVVDNYPGLPAVTGLALLEAMDNQLRQAEIPIEQKKIMQVMPMGDYFACAAGGDAYEAKSLILTVGQTPSSQLPGEFAYLGSGLSYCATCDGMLYRGKDVAVLGFEPSAAEEANFLAGIGCRVTFFGKRERPVDLRPEIPFQKARSFQVGGDGVRITHLTADGVDYSVQGVFILRAHVVADRLLAGIQMDGGHIVTDAAMATSVPGVFAAGDCLGKPYQIAKAIGEGNIAALSADRWLEMR